MNFESVKVLCKAIAIEENGYIITLWKT